MYVEERREQLRQEAADIRVAAKKGFQEPFRKLSGCSGEIRTQTLSTPFFKNSSENRCCLSHRCFASNDRVVGESVADQVCCFLTYSFRREVRACIL